MATVTMQRDLVVNLKRETSLNIGLLSKLQPMPDLIKQAFIENALEKPTQNVFNHLAYYLVSIIDPQIFQKFSWPLYDTKTERAYRGQLSAFINDYSSKGLVSPVMSSYLVNPGCYKVTILIFQLSQLAVQRMLLTKMSNKQKDLYNTMTEKYKSSTEDGFMGEIEKETEIMLSKFSNYLSKQAAMEKIASLLRDRIKSMEDKLKSKDTQKYINDLVDNFLSRHKLDESTKKEILLIKNVDSTAPFFDSWLSHTDDCIKELESKWSEKVSPFVKLCSETRDNTEALISRHTGEADKSSYMVEYDPNTDEIDTKELENEVNTQQKYILKNIVRDGRLYFPNLIRSYLISISHILKNTEIGDEIYNFNGNLETGRQNYSEVVLALRSLNDRVMTAESRLQHSPLILDQSAISFKDFEIPQMPDLSDLKATRQHPGLLFDTFTPISTSKHQFNFRRKYNSFNSFSKPQPKSLVTPFIPPRDDFLKSLISCRVSSYDRPDVSQNFHNISVISQANSRGNETIAECSGFTKQQIMRLMSTKKSSSSKKLKYKTERPSKHVKKGGLFNESTTSNESNAIFRSHSSPNLLEGREKRSIVNMGRRKLSIMQENTSTTSLLEVSGISALEKDNTFGTPEGTVNLKNSHRLIDTVLSATCITPESEIKINMSKEREMLINEEIVSKLETVLNKPMKVVETKEEIKTETPKNTIQLVKNTSSIEKLRSRLCKVRASVLQAENHTNGDFRTILEEKENFNIVNVVCAPNRSSPLPDVVSPPSMKSDYLDQLSQDFDEMERRKPSESIEKTHCSDNWYLDLDEKDRRKPRESLGTALGVDITFLDQFELID